MKLYGPAATHGERPPPPYITLLSEDGWALGTVISPNCLLQSGPQPLSFNILHV
jgi:hypothetical protein